MGRSLEDAVTVQFVRSGGPGGQHVNKVATAVQARLDVARLDLPPPVADRLRRLAGQRFTEAGEIVVFADRFRSQVRNREDAMARLTDLVARAWQQPKRRIPTRLTRAMKARRVVNKKKLGERKKLRRPPTMD